MRTSKAKLAVGAALVLATMMYGCGDGAELAAPQRPVSSAPAVGANTGGDPGTLDQGPADSSSPAQGFGAATSPDQLPCDVGNFLRARCVSCHANPPLPGVPASLVTRADLTKASSRPGQTMAERALELVQSGTMPPGGGATPSEVQAFAAWVQAGAQANACTSAADVGPSAPPPSVCTSERFWKDGDEGSPRMHPGKACIACHDGGREEKGPRFSIAGTIFPSLFEPDDCNGVAGAGVQVVIKGADGRSLTLIPNAAGNFYAEEVRVALPYTAELRYQGRVRAMAQAQSSGDCNTCHTERGTSGAPGRILLP